MLLKTIEADETLERRGLHLNNVLKPQVVPNKGGDLVGILVREAQPPADVFGHARTDFDVLVEPDAPLGSGGGSKRRWLTHVMKEHPPGARWRAVDNQPFEQ